MNDEQLKYTIVRICRVYSSHYNDLPEDEKGRLIIATLAGMMAASNLLVQLDGEVTAQRIEIAVAELSFQMGTKSSGFTI